MRVTKLIATCCLLLIGRAASPAQEWRGIVLMRSTRADVERVLGPTKTAGRDFTAHDFEGGIVSVDYSAGRCRGKPQGWDVPRGRVVGIRIMPNPKVRLMFADLKLDKSKYKKAVEGDVLDIATYRNDDEGVAYDVYEPEGSVSHIRYSPAARYKHLRCTGPPDPDAGTGWVITRKFEAYSDAPPEDERRRLDDFVTQLSSEPGSVGYIVAYAGRGVGAREAIRRAGCARDYLVGVRGFRADRLVRRFGGRRKEFGIELWVRPSGAPAPRPVYGKPDIKEVEAAGGAKMKRGGCKI